MGRIAPLARKLRWRLEFLADPAIVAERTALFARTGAGPLRERLLDEARKLSLRERLAFVNPLRSRRSLGDHLLMRCRRRSADGCEYFDLDGRKIFFRPDHHVANEAELLEGILIILKEAYVYPCEFFSPEVQIAPGDVVLDLGGNVGTAAFRFSRLTGPSGLVFSFEPIFHEVLQRNLRENGIENVRVIPRGVADASGVAEFAITDKGIDSRMDPRGEGGIRRQVEMITLDEFADQEGLERLDFIKMDIEGAEEPAIRGAERIIREFRPRWSIASYHEDGGFHGGEPQHSKLVRLLSESGYRVKEVEQRHIYAW